MNISKFIAKFVLAFFIFSSVQSSIFADGESTVEQSNQQEYERNNDLKRKGEWSVMLVAAYCFMLSAYNFCGCYYAPDAVEHSVKIRLAACGLLCAGSGAYCTYRFINARVWGR